MGYEEYRHPFVGPGGNRGVCHVRVYRPGAHVVIIVSELDGENPGTSVTNAAELIAGEVWLQEGRPPFDRVTFIEHYPQRPGVSGRTVPRRRTTAGDFDRVLLTAGDGQLHYSTGYWRCEVFAEVRRWQHLELAEVEALIGEPWTPIPTDAAQQEQRP